MQTDDTEEPSLLRRLQTTAKLRRQPTGGNPDFRDPAPNTRPRGSTRCGVDGEHVEEKLTYDGIAGTPGHDAWWRYDGGRAPARNRRPHPVPHAI
jgi:hypothetical protein